MNRTLPFPILFAVVFLLGMISQAVSTPSCFGSRTQANAQRGAEVWVRQRPVSLIWTANINRSARVQCHPITSGERWAECRIGPVDTDGTNYVLDCDTAQRNNIGCVPGR